MKKNKIVIIQRVFTDYRKPVFDKLMEKYDLTILHSKNLSGLNQITTDYSILIKGISYSNNPTNVFLFTLKYLRKLKPRVIIHENSIGIISLPFIIFYCKINKIKLVLWGHGYDRFSGFDPKNRFTDKVRLRYMKLADACLFYGNEGKNTISEFISKEKLFVAPNTLDTNKLNAIKLSLKQEGRQNVKKRLGFKDKFNLIYIGRLLKAKNPEKIIELLFHLNKLGLTNVSVHFIGDGEMMVPLQALVKSYNFSEKVFFHGAIHDDKINGEYLYASDLMVMPGYLGLSINHSFCFECPVVSFQAKNHSPEIEYLVSNETGYLAKRDDFSDMAIWIKKYLEDEKMQVKMKENIKYMISNVCSLENMVEGISQSIQFVLN